MEITEEQNETVVHFGRILTEKEIALMEICLTFFQAGLYPNGSMKKETAMDFGHTLNMNDKKETS